MKLRNSVVRMALALHEADPDLMCRIIYGPIQPGVTLSAEPRARAKHSSVWGGGSGEKRSSIISSRVNSTSCHQYLLISKYSVY